LLISLKRAKKLNFERIEVSNQNQYTYLIDTYDLIKLIYIASQLRKLEIKAPVAHAGPSKLLRLLVIISALPVGKSSKSEYRLKIYYPSTESPVGKDVMEDTYPSSVWYYWGDKTGIFTAL
jgi:hypothetical protein